MSRHLYRFDNKICCVFKETQKHETTLIQGLYDCLYENNIGVMDIYNTSANYDHNLLEGKFIYRTFDEQGNPFSQGMIQIYNVDTKETHYFKNEEDYLNNFMFKGRHITEWFDERKCYPFPIVDLSTYLYFRPHINYDCNFIYKGVMYILGGDSYPNMDFYPNYGVVKFMDFNDIDYFKKPDKEDVYQSPLELLENYVLHDGTRLWDIKEEYIFEWYKKAFIGLVEQYL